MAHRKNSEDLADRVAAIQVPLLDRGRSIFSDAEVEDLRCLVRLAVEVEDYLRRLDELDALDADELEYLSNSIAAGVESFLSVAHAYGTVVGSRKTEVRWTTVTSWRSLSQLRERYLAMYAELMTETEFESRCRLVLDLFKLQLVFVGVSYTW